MRGERNWEGTLASENNDVQREQFVERRAKIVRELELFADRGLKEF